MTKFALNLIVIITSSVALAVPLAWTVETSRAELKRFDAYHGETLTIKASLMDCGKPANLDDHTATLYYQTNGMDQAWWTIAGAITGNVAVATFKPADDPGAKQLRFFLAVTGADSNRSYRANGIIRFLDSPGANPGWITPPVVKLDYAQLETLHAPYYTKLEADALHQRYQPRAQSVDLVPGGLRSTMPIALPSGGRPTGFRVPSETTYSNGFIYYKLKNDILNQTYTIDLQRLLTAEADPTVPDWAKAAEPPAAMPDNGVVLTNGSLRTKGGSEITAGSVGAATPVQVQSAIARAGHITAADLEPISTKIDQSLIYSSGVYQYMTGNTNAWFAGTNYVVTADGTTRTRYAWEDGMDASTVPCSMSLWEIRDGKKVVWDQRDWTVWYWNFKSGQLRSDMVSEINRHSDFARTNYMSRGWAKYTAVCGLDNPDPSTLWIDTPKVQLMAGHQWEKIVEVGGAGYWTITGNGIELAPQDADSTYLTVKDFEGNACLTFRKTASYLVYCEGGTDITGNYKDAQGRVVFHLATDMQPTAEFSTILDVSSFVPEGDDGCPANCVWTGSAGAWDCHFLLKDGISSRVCYARFKVLREGENAVECTVPLKLNGGIVIEQDGVSRKIRPTITGSTVNWVVVP